MLMPFHHSVLNSRVAPRPPVRSIAAPMPQTPVQPVPMPVIDASRPRSAPVTHPDASALMALWLAADTMRHSVARRCAALAQHLQEACDAFARAPLPHLRGAGPDTLSVTHALSMALDLPYAPELAGIPGPPGLPDLDDAQRPTSPAGGTTAPPQTPVECAPEALWASFLQLDTIDASGCGADALCTLTLEPLHALVQPVAACHGAAVQVYEYSALQRFWQVYPRRKLTTPSYMPVSALRRVVDVPNVSELSQ